MANQNKEFLALQKQWDAKLKKSGFSDLEQRDGNLKQWVGTFFKRPRFNPVRAEARQEYYRIVGHFLHEYEFANPTDKRVWEFHAEGKSIREIVKLMEKKGYRMYKSKVQDIMKRLVTEMGAWCKRKT